MGILNGARINFWGGIKTNVCVANNSDTVQDAGTAKKTLLDLAQAQVGADGQSMSDQDIIEMMRAPGPKNYYTGGGWNYYGDHQVAFQKAIVSSSGSPGAMTTTGDIVDQPIYLLGSVDPVTGRGPYMSSVMVDLDPTASISTQIFIGGLMIGSPDNPKLHIVEDVVASSRSVVDLNPANPGLIQRQFFMNPDGPGSACAAGTFQVTFSKASVAAWDSSDPALAAIMNSNGMDGIVLRFQMFEMFPELDTPDLVAAYESNQNPSNPSVGRVVGTLAPHFPGEPMTEPAGRELVMDNTKLVGYFDVDQDNQRMMLDALQLYPKGYFRDVRKNYDSDYPIETNVDYGTNTLSAGGSNLTFSANPTDYYLYGGLIDIPLGASTQNFVNSLVGITGANSVTLPANGQVQLNKSTDPIITSFSATENLVRIFGDPRNIYIDDHGGSITITLDVAVLGKPTPLFDEPGGNLIVSIASGSTGALPDGDFLDFPATVPVAQMASNFSFTVSDNGDASKFGFSTLVLTGDQGGCYFINFRKYPNSTFGIATGSTISWNDVYQNALRFYYVTFPAMNMRFPLNDQGTVEANSQPIQARISDAYRATSLYMPITRSMTPSQRALVTQFLNNETWTPLPGAIDLQGNIQRSGARVLQHEPDKNSVWN